MTSVTSALIVILGLASYQIDDNTGLLITLDPPETRYWNLTLESRWHEINEYLDRPASRTLAHTYIHFISG